MKIAALFLVLALAIPTVAGSKVLVVCGGDNQTGHAGSQLPVRLCVMALDSGKPVPGVSVSFTDNGAGGSFSVPVAITDSKGKASTSYTLPGRAATVFIEAVAAGYAPARFRETAK
jgi:hypothetical protein